ncbi:hypothetical protein [Bacillus sp. AK031]
MWNNLSKPWQDCFEQAWKPYCRGSFPIGAAITDENGIVISTGRNKLQARTVRRSQPG